MARSRKRSGRKAVATVKDGGAEQSAGGMFVRITIDAPDGTPTFYSNFIEVSHTKWDFQLLFSRFAGKHSAAKVAEMQASGQLLLPADVVINFPPTIMAGLIRALTLQKEAYERATNTELKDLSDEPTGQN